MIAATPPDIRIYVVQPGDTLWSISEKLFGHGQKWPWFYDENLHAVGRDPDFIVPGELLKAALGKHAVYGTVSVPVIGKTHVPKHAAPAVHTSGTPVVLKHVNGKYTCSNLEALWDAEGGDPVAAFIAAEIARAESSGDADAISPTDDYGLWQINTSWGALATLNPEANARAAILISHDGTDWNPWTTYRTGAYAGQC
jgi:Lysozyme like domain/LysM domain